MKPKDLAIDAIFIFIHVFVAVGAFMAAGGVWAFFENRAPSIFLFALTFLLGAASLRAILTAGGQSQASDAHVRWSGLFFALFATTAALASYLWR